MKVGLSLLAIALCAAIAAERPCLAAGGTPVRPGLDATQVAVIVNTADPLSIAIGSYYAKARRIPGARIVKLHFEYQRDDLSPEEFAALKRSVDRQLNSHVQAYALTWARPYRVGCMSITSAFAFGIDPGYCAAGCQPTKNSPYFNSTTAKPYEELHMRLAISLAATDLEHAKALINRGRRADGLLPDGTAYLVSTNDPLRNVRAPEYALAERIAAHELGFRVVKGAPPADSTDVMFHFTGAATVPGIAREQFLPGAIADHLTSFGGMLTDSPQMSSLRWLEAGATGSYGTVVEPCNVPGKFPNIGVLLAHYLAGETLIEAYWKSVQMPGQGIFLGEPLAAPFRKR